MGIDGFEPPPLICKINALPIKLNSHIRAEHGTVGGPGAPILLIEARSEATWPAFRISHTPHRRNTPPPPHLRWGGVVGGPRTFGALVGGV
jgi:hypothetical protein